MGGYLAKVSLQNRQADCQFRIMRLFGDLTPFIPLSLKGEGESYEREAPPPLDSPDNIYSLVRRGGIIYRRGADAPLNHPYSGMRF